MANFDVRGNEYYRPPVGRNWLADRLIAGMQSFSAPKTGPAGDKVGFGRALLGDDTNRINTAAMLRGQDFEAAKAPFEAEVEADEAQEARRFANQQTLQRGAQEFSQKLADQSDAAQRQRDLSNQQFQYGLRAQDEANARMNRMLEQADAAEKLRRQQAFQREMHSTPSGNALLEAETQKGLARNLGNGAFTPGNQPVWFTPTNPYGVGDASPRPVPETIRFSDAEWNRAFGSTNAAPMNSPQNARTVDRDMEQIQKLLQSPNVPTGISY